MIDKNIESSNYNNRESFSPKPRESPIYLDNGYRTNRKNQGDSMKELISPKRKKITKEDKINNKQSSISSYSNYFGFRNPIQAFNKQKSKGTNKQTYFENLTHRNQNISNKSENNKSQIKLG